MTAKEIILDYVKDKDIRKQRDFTKEAIEIKKLLLDLRSVKIDIIRELEEISFYDDVDFKDNDKYGIAVSLSRFKDAIMHEISPVEPAVFTRRKSPPLEAYEYKGCTRIAKDSGITYGLLFE